MIIIILFLSYSLVNTKIKLGRVFRHTTDLVVTISNNKIEIKSISSPKIFIKNITLYDGENLYESKINKYLEFNETLSNSYNHASVLELAEVTGKIQETDPPLWNEDIQFMIRKGFVDSQYFVEIF